MTITRPKVRIHNTETDEVIDREMNDSEFAKHKADQAAIEEAQAETEAKATARQAILDRLGLTADEAAILLG
jgi:hypothetical protein